MRRLLTLLSLSALLIGVLTIAGPTPASAGVTIQVRSFLDANDASAAGKCSLRSAIQASNTNQSVLFCFHDGSPGRDTIVLKAGTYHLTDSGNDDDGTLGDLDVDGSLLIRGAGASRTIIDASDLSPGDRIFDILGGPVTLRNLTVTGGERPASNGGGIWNSSSLTLDRVTIRQNTGLNGGGLFHGSGATDLDIRNSTFSSNTATVSGGGIGINQTGAELTNVTVSGNHANDDGGGVTIESAGLTALHSVTIANNNSDADNDGTGSGGGLFVNASGNNTLENSLIGKNTDSPTGTKAPDCLIDNSSLSTNHDNLVAKTRNCGFPAGTGNILNEPPGIGQLRDNGGPTRTHAVTASSRAVNAGSGCPPADQRGAPRNRCDIGAYERVSCKGVLVNRVGTSGRDKLVGTAGRDGILALGGRDVVLARGGKDAVCAGAGNDLVRGQGNDDKVVGQAGNDRIFGGPGGDALKGGTGDDLLDGDSGTDLCRGGPGDDEIRACET